MHNERIGKSISVDIGHATFAGVGLGERADNLQSLGRGRSVPGLTITLLCELGVWYDLEGAVLDSFGVCFAEQFDNIDVRPFSGELLLENNPVRGDIIGTQTGIVDTFGKPAYQDENIDETILYYTNSSCEWQFELSSCGRLVAMTVCRSD